VGSRPRRRAPSGHRLSEVTPAPAHPRPGSAPARRIIDAYELTLTAESRRRGAHYTPHGVADRLVELALQGLPGRPLVLDPTCGAGSVLLAVLDRLVDRGLGAVDALASVRGVDTDAGAIEAARAALGEWGRCHGVTDHRIDLRVGDGLDELTRSASEFDLIIGNPPFRSQLRTDRAHTAAERARVRRKVGSVGQRYADLAAVFLIQAARHARPGSRVALIQPRSLLSASDVSALRAELAQLHGLADLWFCGDRVFDAAVEVCCPVLHIGRPTSQTRLWIGADFAGGERLPTPVDGSWAPLAAAAVGVPADGVLTAQDSCPVGTPLGELASIVAPFRAEYYALAEAVSEAPATEARRLLTSGAIDVASQTWRVRPQRFARRVWNQPWVDLERLRAVSARIDRWVTSIDRPKVLVAAQTTVIEAVGDPDSLFVPSTPVIAVVPHDPEDLARILAALSGPTATAWLWHRLGGNGITAGVLRPTSAALAQIQVPTAETMATRIAALNAAASGSGDWETFVELDRSMVGGGCSDDIGQWWLHASARSRPTGRREGLDGNRLRVSQSP